MDMIRKFPLCVHSADKHGNTLCHHAVMTENDKLLSVLLTAQLPMFWLPANKSADDMLSLAVNIKNRTCVKLILDRIIAAKEAGKLARLPSQNDRFLRTLLRIADCMDDLLAQFLRQFALDDAQGVLDHPVKAERGARPALRCGLNECVFLRCFLFPLLHPALDQQQLQLPTPTTYTVGSDHRVPRGMWTELLRQGKLGEQEKAGGIRMTAKYLSIPNMAGTSH